MVRLILVFLVVGLAACSPRGMIEIVPTAVGVGDIQTIFVGTTRQPDPVTGIFGPERLRDATRFARYDVSIPPERTVGDISFPRKGRDPDIRTDFVTTEARNYPDDAAFRADLRRALAAKPAGQREVTVFTHGFNNTFAEGLYRIAQMGHDLELPGVMVHYSWPSAGKTLAYVRDRDSAAFARDGLEKLLNEVAAAGANKIVIVGHSMGAQLTMEVLRQMAIRGDRTVRPRIAGVVLLSPDIDVDVFRSQARTIGRLPQPFFIFTSRKDRALALSARLTGQRRNRLGNLRDVAEVADLEVTVVDVAAYSTGGGHMDLASSPALIQLLTRIPDVNAAYDADNAVRTGLLPGVILTVQSATAIILKPVTAIID